jgi:hypothetical protein
MRVLLHKRTVLVLLASLSLSACSAGISGRVRVSESQEHDSLHYSMAPNSAVEENAQKSDGTE